MNSSIGLCFGNILVPIPAPMKQKSDFRCQIGQKRRLGTNREEFGAIGGKSMI